MQAMLDLAVVHGRFLPGTVRRIETLATDLIHRTHHFGG